MKYQVFIISYKRAGAVTSDRVFRNAKIVIPESQYEEYKKHHYYNGCELLPIPDWGDGNIVKKRNYIMDHFSDMCDGNMVIVDDDYDEIGYIEGRKLYGLDLDGVDRLLENGFQMCRDLGTVMWGLNVTHDKQFYREYSPFSMLSVCLGPFQAFCNNPLRYDERVYLKEDYDMSLQVLQKYHKILRFNKYYYKVNHFNKAGGVVSYRTKQKEIEQLEIMQKKWGNKVVKYNIKKDVDPIVKVPLKGI
ncbi:hypothetical protein [Fictibacillus sp. NRS-1165]|uniref:GREB1-related protein n=1 Tax=Fictibacillus sp. NRS-1165 TaxID=3144463 RepID=UPI003D25009D